MPTQARQKHLHAFCVHSNRKKNVFNLSRNVHRIKCNKDNREISLSHHVNVTGASADQKKVTVVSV